ncbi:Hypothetical protein LUCI_4520 [Lucifera butyrica]|uniref:IstB-like ATP-binding domain-containing protein n=1 Tax=Lucifera butyrica TaxID=1351585 RepID=A0A498REI8_9FIRM|nr:Hypothetical protein LUCI_4520 [Lucifera butyrica]
MDNPQLLRIEENLKKLKLSRTGQKLESLLQEASKNDLSYTDFLDRLLEEEVALKFEKHIALNTTLAKLLYVKTLESFDFSFQPSIEAKVVRELATCMFPRTGRKRGVSWTAGDRKNAFICGTRSQSDSQTLSHLVYFSGGTGCHSKPGLRRESFGRQAPSLLCAQTLDY